MVYSALLPLMRKPRLPVVDWTDAPAELNGLVRFAERRNLVSARVPSHFKRSLKHTVSAFSAAPYVSHYDQYVGIMAYGSRNKKIWVEFKNFFPPIAFPVTGISKSLIL